MRVATYNVNLHPFINLNMDQTLDKIIDQVVENKDFNSCDVICFQELYQWTIKREYADLISNSNQNVNLMNISSAVLGHFTNFFSKNHDNLVIYDDNISKLIYALKEKGFKHFSISEITGNAINLKCNSGLMIASKIAFIEQHEYQLTNQLIMPNRNIQIVKLSNHIYVVNVHLLPIKETLNSENHMDINKELMLVKRHIEEKCGKKGKCIIAGDFNIDYGTDRYSTMCSIFNMHPLKNMGSTWKVCKDDENIYKDMEKESVCDYIISLNMKYQKENSLILRIEASDHYPVIGDILN